MKKTAIFSTLCILGTMTSLHADPWPHRKPGMWEMTMTMSNSPMPPMTSKMCIDRATESSLIELGQSAMQKACTEHNVRVSGGTGTIDSVCKFGKYTQTAHTVVTFTGDTAYRSETHSHMEPAMISGHGDHSSTMNARWSGACPPDMKPGDIVTANGMRMHMDPSQK